MKMGKLKIVEEGSHKYFIYFTNLNRPKFILKSFESDLNAIFEETPIIVYYCPG